MQRIKKGDTVEVIAGKDLGQQGTVLRLILKDERVIVERVNVVKKHQKAQQAGNRQVAAGIVEREAPLQLSNVQLICTQCKARTRVGFRINEEGKKVRVCKHCKQDID
jgi:large subunit ribosomal protein L24